MSGWSLGEGMADPTLTKLQAHLRSLLDEMQALKEKIPKLQHKQRWWPGKSKELADAVRRRFALFTREIVQADNAQLDYRTSMGDITAVEEKLMHYYGYREWRKANPDAPTPTNIHTSRFKSGR